MTIVTGRRGDETVILGLLADRKKETVKAFFMSIPKRLRKQVCFVCSDRYVGFINAAKEVFGKRFRSSSIDFMSLSYMERVWMICEKKRWHVCGRTYQKSSIKS
ncbi:MAG: transposase [Candidatus Competibacteraceae bacterium]|nr:transposase [Candidatus Competibacteraceae bacterium]